MAVNLDKELLWNVFVPHLFAAVHCHPSSLDNIGGKCSSSWIIRWLDCPKDGYEPGKRIVVGMDLFLIGWRLCIAILLLLII